MDRNKKYNENNPAREKERMAHVKGKRSVETTEHYKNRDENRRLHFLRDLSDYKVASDDPDVRGWEVVDVNNRPVGKIDDLLVDIRREKVRYLDVDLNQDIISEHHDPLEDNKASGVHEYIKRDGDIHMIVPIGLARVDRDNKKVISDEINRSILERGHLHRKGDIIEPEYEHKVIESIRASEQTAAGYTGENREVYDMRKSTSPGSTERSTMRNPATGDMPRRSPEGMPADRGTGFGKESPEANREVSGSENPYREARDRGRNIRGRGLEDERLDRRTRDAQTRGPINDDFYDQTYFDDRRFYGKR